MSRWRGLASLASLGLSIAILITFVLPALLDGRPPLAVAVVGASTIMIATLYLSYGFSVRTSVALLGTLVSLTLTGVLGLVFTTVGRFTGLVDEASAYLGAVGASIDIQGLLLAGLVIGALGVLDDVTVTQTAAVWELADADPEASRRSLFAAGLRIGRQHVSATVNTLVLAYAGASLPLLLLFAVSGSGPRHRDERADRPGGRAGARRGLGIIAAVPLTTSIAALAVRERPRLRRVAGAGRARPSTSRPRRPQDVAGPVGPSAWLPPTCGTGVSRRRDRRAAAERKGCYSNGGCARRAFERHLGEPLAGGRVRVPADRVDAAAGRPAGCTRRRTRRGS